MTPVCFPFQVQRGCDIRKKKKAEGKTVSGRRRDVCVTGRSSSPLCLVPSRKCTHSNILIILSGLVIVQ